jgi:L-asparaginase
VGSGYVSRNVEIDDDARGFVAAGRWRPPQARVVLALALTVTEEVGAIQGFFAP